jgi:hypothetical protein
MYHKLQNLENMGMFAEEFSYWAREHNSPTSHNSRCAVALAFFHQCATK